VAALAARVAETGASAAPTQRWVVAQGVEMGRPSRLELEVDVAGGAIGAVRVGGAAVPVIEGEIRLPAGSGEPEQGA
jgi:trans-2,3-dihydro-3-hydroxyanthranilate isomerase